MELNQTLGLLIIAFSPSKDFNFFFFFFDLSFQQARYRQRIGVVKSTALYMFVFNEIFN